MLLRSVEHNYHGDWSLCQCFCPSHVSENDCNLALPFGITDCGRQYNNNKGCWTQSSFTAFYTRTWSPPTCYENARASKLIWIAPDVLIVNGIIEAYYIAMHIFHHNFSVFFFIRENCLYLKDMVNLQNSWLIWKHNLLNSLQSCNWKFIICNKYYVRVLNYVC